MPPPYDTAGHAVPGPYPQQTGQRLGEPIHQAAVLPRGGLGWPQTNHEWRWDPNTPRSVHFNESAGHGDVYSVKRQASAPEVLSPSRSSIDVLGPAHWSQQSSPEQVTPRGESTTPRGLPQELARRSESPRRRVGQRGAPRSNSSSKKVEPGPRARPGVSRASSGARLGGGGGPVARGGGSPFAPLAGGGAIAMGRDIEASPSPRAGAVATAARSPRDDRVPGVGGHGTAPVPGRGSSADLAAADAARLSSAARQEAARAEAMRTEAASVEAAHAQALRAETARAEEAASALVQVQRELEESRRENSRFQEKLCKAKSLMLLVQKQAEEARAERDRERLRAESLQKSSQQLMRQLKRESAKVHLLERHLSAAARGEQWRQGTSLDVTAASEPCSVEPSKGADVLSPSKETPSIGSLQVRQEEMDNCRSGVAFGEPGLDGGQRDDLDGGDAEGGLSSGEDGGWPQCGDGGVSAAEAAGGCGLSVASPGESTQRLELAQALGGSMTPRSGQPESGYIGDQASAGFEMQKSWEFVVQGQHDPARQQDFAQKIVSCYPDDAVERAQSRGVACVCNRGRRLDRSVPNQDDFVAARHTLVHGGHIALYGVFDGHGPAGHHCAAFARGALPESLFGQRTLLLRPEDTLREAFRQTQASLLEQPFDTEHSGTTVALALVLSLPAPIAEEASQSGEAWLFVAHVGDSRAILASHRGGDPSAFTVTALTRDHRPDDADEAERVRQAGGEVRKLREGSGAARVFACGQDRPGLALTRSLGASAAMDCGVTAEPEVSAYRLRPGVDVLLVLGTDGLFEFCSNTTAAGQILKEGVTAASLQELCAASRQQWAQSSYNETVDDITAVAAALPPDALGVGSAVPPS